MREHGCPNDATVGMPLQPAAEPVDELRDRVGRDPEHRCSDRGGSPIPLHPPWTKAAKLLAARRNYRWRSLLLVLTTNACASGAGVGRGGW